MIPQWLDSEMTDSKMIGFQNDWIPKWLDFKMNLFQDDWIPKWLDSKMIRIEKCEMKNSDESYETRSEYYDSESHDLVVKNNPWFHEQRCTKIPSGFSIFTILREKDVHI